MKKKSCHNTRQNSIKLLFKAPEKEMQGFLSSLPSWQIVGLLLLLVGVNVSFFHTAESKRSQALNFGTAQIVNIYPTQVETADWAGVENVFSQDLADDALYQEFSAINSAYVPQDTLVLPNSFAPTGTSSTSFIKIDALHTSPSVIQAPAASSTVSTTSTAQDLPASLPADVSGAVTPSTDTADVENTVSEEEADAADISEPAVEEAAPAPVEADTSLEASQLEGATAVRTVWGVFEKAFGLFPLAQLTLTSGTPLAIEEPEPTAVVADPVPPAVTSEIESEAVQAETVPTTTPENANSTSSSVTTISNVLSTGTSTPGIATTSAEVDSVEISTTNQLVHEVTLSNFDTAPLGPGQFIDSMQLRLSFAAQLETPASGTAPYVEVLYGEGGQLQSAGGILLEDEISNAQNGGYFLFALPLVRNVQTLASTTVVLRYHGESELLDGMFLDAVWLELNTRVVTKEDLKARGVGAVLTQLEAPTYTTLISEQLNFGRFERPVFNLRYNEQRNALVRGWRGLLGNDVVTVESVLVSHQGEGPVGVSPLITTTKEGLITVEFEDKDLVKLRPGNYSIELTLNEGGVVFTDTFDFEWGVLSINPSQSEYETGETAQISIGALTPNGHTICKADFNLFVTDPAGFMTAPSVNESGRCDGNNVVDVPDFNASVPTTVPGTYELYLERLDENGNVLAFTSDTFLVVDDQSLAILRDGPTRIYPPAYYPMTLTVETDSSFTGTLTERVPVDFDVFNTEATVTENGNEKMLTWNISILGAGSKTVSYDFDAPDLSPYLYNLGPAELISDNQSFSTSNGTSTATSSQPTATSFLEHRQWQIASDAVGNMILFWDDGTTIPTGWTCLSCGSGTFYQRFAYGSSTYNTTGGAATHTHTAVGSVLASTLATTESGSGTIAPVAHSHTYSPTIASASNLPAYRQLRVIQYTDAAGEPTDIPTGAIGIFDATVPSGWTRYSAQDGYYIYGENTPGTTGGGNTHTHAISGTTGTAGGTGTRNRGGGAATGALSTHTHTVGGSTAATSTEPRYIEVILGKLDATTTPPNGLIAMWTEEVDGSWLDISSLPGDPFNQRFLKASTTYGLTNGQNTHTAANVTGITSSGPSANSPGNQPSGTAGASGAHTHSVNVTTFSTDSHLPSYLTVVFGKRQGTDPVYTEQSFRWYGNSNAQTPTDPWPSGASDLAENESVTALSTPVKEGERIRLRLNASVSNATSSVGSTFALQYAAAVACSAAGGWYNVGDTSSTTALWRGYNNTSVTDHGTLSSQLLASSTVAETYEENGYATSTPSQMSVGDFGEWDFVLQHNNALPGTNYCFRLVESDGTVFSSYAYYPQLYTNEAPDTLVLETPFDNEKTASTTPWFEFYATDAESDKVHYEIEIDNDYDFSSPVHDLDTQNASEDDYFENQVLISDKAPFIQGNLIRVIPPSSLTNGTTYYWRVRAEDPDGSADWGNWSTTYSVTVDTALTASAWFQTEDEQFDTNALSGVQTGSDQVSLISGSTTGTMSSGAVDFDDGALGTAWDSLAFADTETTGDIKYQIEYLDTDDTWSLVPDSVLAGNAAGFDTSPVSLLALDIDTYNVLRVVATFTNAGGTPSLQDWTFNWGYRVETPTVTKLFANEQVGTTTPTFEFATTDPQSDSLTYQLQWSLTPDFTSSTTRTSDVDAGFTNIDTGLDTDPFNSGETIQFTIQPVDVLSGSTTYWWRVRAKDTTGDNAYSFWTEGRSFTVVPGTDVSTWLQTTEEQFDTNVLSGVTALPTDVMTVATTASEAILVYGEGVDTEPRYRQWNGSLWGGEGTLLDIGAPLRQVVVEAGTTREEYVAATVGSDADVNVQVFTTGVWGDLLELATNVGNISAQGFDVAYETDSGDAMVAYCDGDADPSYYIWNGSGWTSGGTINLNSTSNCEWLQLAADPTSDEIILLSRDAAGNQYEAQVWSGSAWGNATTQGSIVDTALEGMAVMYEESGGQALIVTSDGNPARFRWNSWNGTSWGTAATQAIGDDLEWAHLARDIGSDAMVLCYQDEDTAAGVVRWTGSAWAGQTELVTDANGNAKTDPGFDCVYEDTAGRSGYIMTAISTTTAVGYFTYNTTNWSSVSNVDTLGDSVTMQLARTGDNTILGVFFDDPSDTFQANTWNGTTWSSLSALETNASVDTSPFGHPYRLAPRNSGREGTTVVSPALDFDDGTGPYWDSFSWNDSVPGASEIRYHMEYYTATGSWAFIPDVDLPGNVAGTTTGPFDLSSLNTNTYNVIRPYAELTCDGSGNCPDISDWKINWAGGITVSGTIDEYDQATAVTSGTVAVAVNGVLQTGKTGTVGGGTWSISNVTAFSGDVVTVFVTSALDADEAVGVTRYDGQGDITGLVLYERHLTLGSDDATTTPITHTDIGLYDFTNTEDVFFNVTGSALLLCADNGCGDVELHVLAATYYTPGGRFVTHDFENNGIFAAGSYAHEINGSWDNNATTTLTGSTLVFAATSTTETIDNTGAVSTTFANLTFGTTTGNGTWTPLMALDVDGNLSVTRGTFSRGITAITIGGNLVTGANGFWAGIGTTTFDGNTAATWNDQNAIKQNIGRVVVDGTSKIVTLAGTVAAESITIGANDTFDASTSNFDITVYGRWYNQNNFISRSGEVRFAATSSTHTITTAGDAFYDLTFNGSGGSWSFTESTVQASNDVQVAAGTVTFPTATTTIGGSFIVTGGTFAHNNGTLYFTSNAPETLTFVPGAFTNVAHNLTFAGAGNWTITDIHATSTNDVRVLQGTLNFPTGVFAIGGALADSGGAFVGGSGTLLFYSSGAEVIATGGSTYHNVEFNGSGTWSFSDATATMTGDLTVTQGTLTLPSTLLSVGGSYLNSATVLPGTGTVTFNSSDVGETLNFGNSSLFSVIFNSVTGGWTITDHATTTNSFTLSAVNDFTLAAGQTLSVGGEFSNNVSAASTTWTGGTLALRAGNYGINTKTSSGDSYETLAVATGTHISMWNSSAATYMVTTGGSLYSQDHNTVDGDLYIFGNYPRVGGTEYWSYATDFDGTDLSGGSERQVNVRFASGASASITGSSLAIAGESYASTTIASQGTGTYSVAITGGTTSAQYYEFTDLGGSGLSLLGGVAVPTFSNGLLVVGDPFGSALTLSSTTIDADPGKQINNVAFATTTAITATNVSQTDGAPASFWWFRDGGGNLYGEAFDNDTGNPGSVRFDDSSLVITVAGTVYSDAGTTPLVGGTCDGVDQVVRVVVENGLSYTGSCSNVDGTYSIGGVVIVGDPTLTVYLDDAQGGEQGSAVTRTPTTDITDMDIYVNRVIVRHEDTNALTIANLAAYDFSDDTDIRYLAATTSNPDTLTTLAGTELFVFATSTFTPGGVVTLAANAAPNGYDGTLYIDENATFNAYSTSTLTIGGRLVLEAAATFDAASTTVHMNATSSGKSITGSSSIVFNELEFNGTGGGWNVGADIVVGGDLSLTAGTVTGTGDLTLLDGSLSGNGVLSLGAGTTTIAHTNTLGGSSAWTFYNLQLGDGIAVGTTTPLFTGTTTVSGRLTIAPAHFFDAGGTDWDLAGTGTVFVENGTFLEDTSSIRYSGAGANVLSTNYYDLELNAAVGSPTYTATGLGIIVENDLSLGGAAATTFDLSTSDPALDVDGDVLIESNGTLSTSDTANFTIAGNYTNNGTLTSNNGTLTFDGVGTQAIAAGASSFGSITINATGDVTVTEHATATAAWRLLNANTFTVSNGQVLAVGGTFVNDEGGAATIWTGATLRLYGGGNYTLNTATTSDTYATLAIADSTQIRMWNSSATTYGVATTASLYSQDHAAVDGNLYIWGAYQKTAGTDHWSYDTDFDGTTLSGNERKVDVFFASGASATYTGGALAVYGSSSASTTLQNQGTGTYTLTVGGTASTSLRHYEVRDVGSSGIVFTGTPQVTTLSHGDFGIAQAGGSAITVGGSVITNNPAKNFTQNRFALDGAPSGFNVTATGTTVSAWRFANHYGGVDGEANDVDPGGDPGYVAWDDSAALITVSGSVYSDEGSTVSNVCDGSSNVVELRVAGITSYSTSCNATTGAYSISNVSYGTTDSLVVYINGTSSKGATVTKEPVSNINDLNIYENRVIVRHENVNPITIADLAAWDSGDDGDIPFTSVDAGTDTLTLPANRKLIVWNAKEFAPNGNVTVTGGGAGADYDGTLELLTDASWDGQGTESLTIGGSFILGSGADFSASNGTTTFTTTGLTRTIDVNNQSFQHLNFTGSGSWVVSDDSLTVGGDLRKSAGALTLPTGTSTFAGSFVQTGGTFDGNDGLTLFTGTGTVTAGGSDFADVTLAGGTYTFGDTNATTTGTFTIESGTVTLPSGTLTVGGNFANTGGAVIHNTADLKLMSTTTATLLASSSDLYAINFGGGGAYTILDADITFLDSVFITDGAVILASGTLSIGGSFDASGGTFSHASNTILFNSSDGGEFIDPGVSAFYSVQIGAPTGGYTLAASATTTNNFTLANAGSFTLQSGATLKVEGVFTNSVGGANTTWAGSVLVLDGANAYSLNTKTTGGDVYDNLIIGADSDIRMWNSIATTSTAANSSLYSQDHNAVDGALYIYGDFTISTTSEYWSYATDFDGTTLSGSERAVTVSHAGNATTTLLSGSLAIIGESGNETTIQNQGSGTYIVSIAGGTLNAERYAFRNLGSDGLSFSGTPVITSLSYGDFELQVDGGTLLTLSSTTLNANASMVHTGNRFATTSAISGANVTITGSTSNAWTFVSHTGNLDGESFDVDGVDDCGSVRWSDSSCLLTQQTEYRWRNDDGGLGVPDSEWYDPAWAARKQVRVVNTDSTSYTNAAVQLLVEYDSDMQADFEDLRFTDETGTTTIPFWIGSTTASGVAEVWVQVATLPAEDTSTLYLYYNNPTATSTSSSTEVFIAADDFEDDNISEYSGQTSLFNTDTSFSYDGTYGLDNSGNTTGRANLGGIYRLDQTVSQGETIRFWQYIDTTGTSDETCVKFAIQGTNVPNDNYAVCVEMPGTDHIAIAKDVTENESSGSTLASVDVSFTTGWYEFELDWGTNDALFLSLYDASHALVATTSATDSAYTSGGFGFTYWYNQGGSDSFSSRPTVTTEPTIFFGAEQGDGGASWAAAESASATYNVNDTARLRVLIANSGLPITGQQFRLEFAAQDTAPSCEAVDEADYVPVPPQASCGTSAVCMQASNNVTNGASIADLLVNAAGTFTAGEAREDPSNTTSALDVDQDEYTELEYVITPTVNVVDENLCFRVTDNGTFYDTYLQVARMTLRFDPVVGSITLNNGQSISLLPGTTTAVVATGTVSDLNGYTDLAHATGTFYRGGVAGGASCAADNNNCYITDNSACTFTNCAGDSCIVSCQADIYFHADPTDTGSTYDGEEWFAFLEVEDTVAGYDFGTSIGQELNTLRAINIDGAINYGSVAVSSDTGAQNATTSIENQGNVEINIEVEGTDMTDGYSSTIPSTEQKFATSTFTYSLCGASCNLLSSTTPVLLNVDLSKPTASTPPVTDTVYWGIAVPFGINSAPHQGLNVFTPVSP